MDMVEYPKDAASLRDEIKDYLRNTIADHGTSMDTGGGFGCADLWVKVGGIEYFISVKRSGSQARND